MKKPYYFFLYILLILNISCKNSVKGCLDPSANNFNASATINDDCCYNCYTSLGYSVGEYCNYNLDFILENEFDGLIQCFSVNGDVVPASAESAQEGAEILNAQGEPVFWPYSSFDIYCN